MKTDGFIILHMGGCIYPPIVPMVFGHGLKKDHGYGHRKKFIHFYTNPVLVIGFISSPRKTDKFISSIILPI